MGLFHQPYTIIDLWSEEEHRLRSMEITSYFLKTTCYQNSKSVHLYDSIWPEVNTLFILDHIKSSERTSFFPTKDPYQNQKTDVIIVPGRKFDLHMNRKGKGKGYYDRFLKETNAIKVGICFELQLDRQKHLNSKPHDISMDMIITEKGIISPLTSWFTPWPKMG